MAIFVCTINFNWSWDPIPARAGRLVMSLRNPMAFFVYGGLKNAKRKYRKNQKRY